MCDESSHINPVIVGKCINPREGQVPGHIHRHRLFCERPSCFTDLSVREWSSEHIPRTRCCDYVSLQA
jgi:hypothetical protein